MRKDAYKMSKPTKRVLALMPGTDYKKIMTSAEMTYETMRHRKVKEKDSSSDEAK